MALESTHPLYQAQNEDWTQMRDLYKGERHIKAKGVTYLPPTQGMIIDGMGTEANPSGAKQKVGQKAYEAYKMRAVFPDFVKEAVEAYIGLLHQKPPTIELPAALEPMRERATLHGESLELLLRRINEEQLVTGRCGLLLDLPLNPDQANPVPYIALYIGEAIRNWDDGEIGEGLTNLNFVVLDESGYKRDADFEWSPVAKYRVLMMQVPAQEGDGEVDAEDAAAGNAVYMVGVFANEGGGPPQFVASDMKAPSFRGGELEEIPFTFVNSKDIVSGPDAPPLLGLGNLALAIYRGEADYRQNLFMQGQDTLVVIGSRKKPPEEEVGDAPLRTGAGSVIELEAEPGADAKYAGVTSEGLAEQRNSLENDRKRAETRSGQLISSGNNGDVESGEALKTRVAAQTATLNQLALTGAAALEAQLKIAAKWVGADPEQVKVTPNLEFADFEMTGENLVKLMTARSMGAPISKASIHALMVDQGLTKMDFETEQDIIEEENANDPLLQGLGTGEGGNPDDPNDPNNQNLDDEDGDE